MSKAVVTTSALAALLWAASALADPTAQQNCDGARIKAWAKYRSCIEKWVGKEAVGNYPKWGVKMTKCRRKYFKAWTKFQDDPLYAGSTCVGNRFVDGGATTTDNLTELVWEKKTNDASVHDASNSYAWDAVFHTLLVNLNTNGFAGSTTWRMPTLAETLTIVLAFPCSGSVLGGPSCSCPSIPCADPAFGPVHPAAEWTATTYLPARSDDGRPQRVAVRRAFEYAGERASISRMAARS